MKTVPIKGKSLASVVGALKKSDLFQRLDEESVTRVVAACSLARYEPGEEIVRVEDKSDAFYITLQGEAAVLVHSEAEGTSIEVARLEPYSVIGEIGLLLDQPRGATVVAKERMLAIRFEQGQFFTLFDSLPGFGLFFARALAIRIQRMNQAAHEPSEEMIQPPDPDVVSLLPLPFIQRHRVLPLTRTGTLLEVGFVDDPTPKLIDLVRQNIPAMEIRTRRIGLGFFDETISGLTGIGSWDSDGETSVDIDVVEAAEPSKSPKLDQLLERMVAEGASDLHLAAAHKPSWRVHGDLSLARDAPRLGREDVLDLLHPVMPVRNREEFKSDGDTDFAYAIEDLARFRVNMYQDHRGVGAVMRVIPSRIMTIDELGLPATIADFCTVPKGMVLVTGPTGSGKSTTLAAMIDHVNRNRREHIITMEDPVEFVHQSRRCLVTQREVLTHTQSFARALRAALREDPDVVLIGEIRDMETMSMALATANTGHLVFATLHTNSALSTVDRIIEMYPADEQNFVRAQVSGNLVGVVSQMLCKRIGGGRIGVFETLVMSPAMANLIREKKTFQLISLMQAGRAYGNRLFIDEFANLVNEGLVDVDEALSKSTEPDKLRAKLMSKSM